MKISVFTSRIPDGENVVWFNAVTERSVRFSRSQDSFLDRILTGDLSEVFRVTTRRSA